MGHPHCIQCDKGHHECNETRHRVTIASSMLYRCVWSIRYIFLLQISINHISFLKANWGCSDLLCRSFNRWRRSNHYCCGYPSPVCIRKVIQIQESDALSTPYPISDYYALDWGARSCRDRKRFPPAHVRSVITMWILDMFRGAVVQPPEWDLHFF